MAKNFKVVFESNITGKNEKKAEQELFKGHNRMCELVNPCLETWNKIFDRDHPDYDGDYEDPDSEYMKYMSLQHAKTVNLYMNAQKFSKLLRYEVGKECNLEGVLWKDPTQRISFHLEEMA